MKERYLVMPRGINVGSRNRVPMADLRAVLTAAGYSDVTTVLQSGNVIVSTKPDHPDIVADTMQRLLSDEFDVNVPCVVRTAKQVRHALDRNPLQEVVTDPSRYLMLRRATGIPWRRSLPSSDRWQLGLRADACAFEPCSSAGCTRSTAPASEIRRVLNASRR